MNEKKSQRIIFYALFLLMQKHKEVWAPHGYKSHYALFLKHNFRNFEGISEEAIRRDIRGRYPKRMER
ncbi:MAG: hypothetical protein KDE33_19270, partial [Bacteroidetes bacterium]|nr:hypothetical protein [Bacteroidota bacterium]